MAPENNPRVSPKRSKLKPNPKPRNKPSDLALSDPTSLRRSPRFLSITPSFDRPTLSLRKSPRLDTDFNAILQLQDRRRSPRLCNNAMVIVDESFSEKQHTRKSPRFKNNAIVIVDESFSEKQPTRKSPRFGNNVNLTLHDRFSENQPTRKSPRFGNNVNGNLHESFSEKQLTRKSPRFGNNDNVNSNESFSEKQLTRKSPRPGNNGAMTLYESIDEKQPKKKQKTSSDSSKSNKEEDNKKQSNKKKDSEKQSNKKKGESGVFFIGDPVPVEEAQTRWPWRFLQKPGQVKQQSFNSDGDDDNLVLNVKCHYLQANIEGCIFYLGDCAYVKGTIGGQNFVGRILEFFKTLEDEDYFRVQWFYRVEDTVIKEEGAYHDKKRLFYSELMNDNLLDCIVSKVKIVEIAPNVKLTPKTLPPCDFYYDMQYSVDYSTFSTMVADNCILSSSDCMKTVHVNDSKPKCDGISGLKPCKSELALLDLFSGCGGMSTGLCLGAKISGLDLVTRWAVDIDKSACETLKLNHPETQIRNESAEDFLHLLKEWDKLCKQYVMNGVGKTPTSRVTRGAQKDMHSRIIDKIPSDEYEVASIVDICYEDPCERGTRGLKFQVRWAGYGPSEDTWEPIEGLRKCQDRIEEFVLKGIKAKILPRPEDVDVICGGPPCQGISGYNRYRNHDSPMDDERNRQIVIFMDIVKFLKPKYVLMENVADILKFAKGCLGRYALSRLVQMNYQARLGIMAAGCYGLAQFRLRVFLWGAHPHEKLPLFPLPTHDVVVRYGAPTEFERNVVAYDEGQIRNLEKALVLSDAISDLPPVTNHETREEMPYGKPPETEFQKYVRATKCEMMGFAPQCVKTKEKSVLYDHRPLPLSEDDYLRVCQIPRKKGANFRDLPGVIVGPDNVARRDPTAKAILMPSGRPLIPDYALNFEQGKSARPFARLWWDETVPTVLCRPDPHSQVALHPEQDRIITLRESARLQGFPDYYKFCGDIKQRYCQVGNAVAIPVARALGYTLGIAAQKLSRDEPLMTLPPKFSHSTTLELLNPPSNEVE